MSDPIKPADRPGSLLFLCNHNIIRSPMAEAIAKHRLGRDVFVDSAGITTGTIDPFVTEVMGEWGIDISRHTPKKLVDVNDSWVDLIITLSPQAHHIALLMESVEAAEVLYWAAADPTVIQGSRAQMVQAYRDVRDGIAARIDEHFGIQAG